MPLDVKLVTHIVQLVALNLLITSFLPLSIQVLSLARHGCLISCTSPKLITKWIDATVGQHSTHPPPPQKPLSPSDVQKRDLHFASVCATHKQILDRFTKAIEWPWRNYKWTVVVRIERMVGKRKAKTMESYLPPFHCSLCPPSHLYRCHGCIVLSWSKTLKDSQAVEANNRGHHQVAVEQIKDQKHFSNPSCPR